MILMNPTVIALTLAVPLILLGLGSGYYQIRGRRAFLTRKLVPSEEAVYLRGRYRRRLLAAGLMIVAGLLIAGAYLGGLEAHADALAAPSADGNKKVMSPEVKQFLWIYELYWIGVILLGFALVSIAFVDAWASRRYWLIVYKQMKEDHQTLLRRDLAVYRQDREQRNNRGGRWKPGETDTDAEPPRAL
ncbi:hypothetical protein BH11PLA2_BH11PLA2_40580 [soil metagenome]